MFVDTISENSSAVETINLPVDKYIQYFSNLWQRSVNEFPGFKISYSKNEKQKCEKDIEKFFGYVKKEAQKNRGLENWNEEFVKKCSLAIHGFLRDRLSFRENDLESLFNNNFIKVSSEFIKKAHAYDTLLGDAEIFQALRNVWTMNWVQLILNLPIELTPSIFAYSLLYPYTDNYLDDPGISSIKKMEFNTRLSKRLTGESIEPENKHEQIVYNLIEMIEEQFNRELYPQVYKSLLAIHSAQIKSLLLLNSNSILAEEDLVNISLEKGGTSVLADGYLIAGNLTEEQERFLFGYGAYLQLVDDMQDAINDRQNGFSTIFSNHNSCSYLDSIANHLFHFGNLVIDDFYLVDLFSGGSIINLMKRTNELLIINGVGVTKDNYSPDFSKKMEIYSPFSFSFIQQKQNNYFQIGLMS